MYDSGHGWHEASTSGGLSWFWMDASQVRGVRVLGKTGCRLVTGLSIQGYEAMIMENRRLAIWILPGKGGDIVQFLYKPKDVDFTWSTVWGLRAGSLERNFTEQYKGGWQEVFPNGGTPVTYRGAELGQHDEVARLPWHWQVLEESVDCVQVKLSVDLIKTPFRLEKVLTLRADSGLRMEETALNLSAEEQYAMWGQHLAFGSPLLTPDCRIDTTARTVLVVDGPSELRRYRPGRYEWPWVDGVEGQRHDLRVVPGRDGTRDIVYLTDFPDGHGGYRLIHPGHGLALAVSWDASVLTYCWYWQEFGAPGYPWYGRHYNIGLEPFRGYPTHGLLEAIDNQTALRLAGGARQTMVMDIEVHDQDAPMR